MILGITVLSWRFIYNCMCSHEHISSGTIVRIQCQVYMKICFKNTLFWNGEIETCDPFVVFHFHLVLSVVCLIEAVDSPTSCISESGQCVFFELKCYTRTPIKNHGNSITVFYVVFVKDPHRMDIWVSVKADMNRDRKSGFCYEMMPRLRWNDRFGWKYKCKIIFMLLHDV